MVNRSFLWGGSCGVGAHPPPSMANLSGALVQEGKEGHAAFPGLVVWTPYTLHPKLSTLNPKL
jgi:hypothetical protein